MAEDKSPIDSIIIDGSNDAPSSLNIEEMAVYENLVGAELGLISAYDPDGDQLNFELSGSNSHHFDLIPYEGPAITLDGWQGVTLKLNDNCTICLKEILSDSPEYTSHYSKRLMVDEIIEILLKNEVKSSNFLKF